jgi:hypothetical protein
LEAVAAYGLVPNLLFDGSPVGPLRVDDNEGKTGGNTKRLDREDNWLPKDSFVPWAQGIEDRRALTRPGRRSEDVWG